MSPLIEVDKDEETGQEPIILNGRFEILETLGEGAQGTTYLAEDSQSGERIAIKELKLGRLSDWKAQELFEREGDVLGSLDHPQIPSYIDAFTVDEDDDIAFYLAQEFVEGKNLEEALTDGERWDEQWARADLDQLLDILEYLHGFDPPVIHRDIKPSNLIRRPDGSLALIDFGAVQNVVPTTVGGSTIVGTPGYMPHEHVLGQAVPATDIYAVGATLVHLLSRTHPSELSTGEGGIEFREQVNVSDEFEDVLAGMLTPWVDERFASVSEVREEFAGADEPSSTVVRETLDRINLYQDWLHHGPTAGGGYRFHFPIRNDDETKTSKVSVRIDGTSLELKIRRCHTEDVSTIMMFSLVWIPLIGICCWLAMSWISTIPGTAAMVFPGFLGHAAAFLVGSLPVLLILLFSWLFAVQPGRFLRVTSSDTVIGGGLTYMIVPRRFPTAMIERISENDGNLDIRLHQRTGGGVKVRLDALPIERCVWLASLIKAYWKAT